MLPTIAIVFTGGTIASTLDEGFGGVVPSLTGGQILAHVPGLDAVATVIAHEYGAFPGPHITPQHMLEISTVVGGYATRSDISGIVVTHGTDTLEETAYFLDCTVNTHKPVVVIGAMRNSSEPDWDGPRNIRDAVLVCGNSSACGKGVMVVLGGEVLAASEATKADTEDINTFTSMNFGPLGRVVNNQVLMHRSPLHRDHFSVDHLPEFVPLLKCYAGMDRWFIDEAVRHGARGIVIEAFGVGNVTPLVAQALTDAVAQGIPVVLVSRCPIGRVEHVYAYEGAGKQLYRKGVIFADYLNGPKARIKLMCALAANKTMNQIRESFEWVNRMESAD